MSPERVTVPAYGSPSPARILIVVVFPAPFLPTRPIRSPGWTRSDDPSNWRRVRTPARTSRSSMVITCAGTSLAGEGTDWAAGGPTSHLTVGPRDQQTPVTWVSGVRNSAQAAAVQVLRSEERRVGKEGRCRGWRDDGERKKE